jgi:hypothetical protein
MRVNYQDYYGTTAGGYIYLADSTGALLGHELYLPGKNGTTLIGGDYSVSTFTNSTIFFAVTVKEKLGYEPIVVRCNSEYVLEKDEIVSMNDAIREEVDTETIDSARNTLSGIHRKIEDILYNANLAIDESLSTEQLIRINNIIQELEKSTINLGAAVTEENRTAK